MRGGWYSCGSNQPSAVNTVLRVVDIFFNATLPFVLESASNTGRVGMAQALEDGERWPVSVSLFPVFCLDVRA